MARFWKTLAAGTATLGASAAINARITGRAPRLESVLDGERRYYPWDQGYVFYAVRGEGPPLVLVHGVYPGAASHEWSRTFTDLAAGHRVHALDLLGFGLSDRPRITYDPPLYESLLGDFLQDIVGEPAAVCATSLAAAFAVHTAFQRPAAVGRLVLIGPTGLYDWADPPAIGNFLLHRALRFPLLGLSAYYGMTSRAALERFARARLYAGADGPPPDLLDAQYTAAHQAGASYATSAFLAGLLNEPVDGVFGDLRQPVLLAWGRHSRLAPVANAGGFASLNPTSELEVFEHSGALPHVEEPARFTEVVLDWLARRPSPAADAGEPSHSPPA